MKIISIVGARPNFMKIAPFIHAVKEYNRSSSLKIKHILIHTGQHYDIRMSELFFKQLDIPKPDYNLEVGSGSHSEQVGNTMIKLEKVLLDEKPDWVVVVGDVNATIASSITAKKQGIKCCHIEAGLRSGDMNMPEEINRLVTDRLADLLLTPDRISVENLIKEGISQRNIKFVGNIMIDTLRKNEQKARKKKVKDIIYENTITSFRHETKIPDKYGILTIHRPSNVDDREILSSYINFILKKVLKHLPMIWPIHPRTKKMLEKFNLWEGLLKTQDLFILEPLTYIEMLKLNMKSSLMLTDSGGLQEECTILGTPCLTLRWNTERPITLKENGGATILVGNNINKLSKEFHNILHGKFSYQKPELWDGKTAERCLNAILDYS